MINAWAAAHLAWADLEVEAKAKNLASHDLAEAVRAAESEPAPRKLASGGASR